jgi:hypothetical protein
VFLWNLRGVEEYFRKSAQAQGSNPPPDQVASLVSNHFPPQMNCLALALGLDQGWGMFAPSPGKFGGWCIAQATLRDNSKVDLLRGGAPVSLERPPDINATYGNERWHRWYMCVYSPSPADLDGGPPSDYTTVRPCYADYLCRTWNAAHPEPEQQVETIELFFMLERTAPPGQPPPPVQTVPLKMPDGGTVWRAGQGPGLSSPPATPGPWNRS